MNEWQPIETAPKDGTEVLIYGGTMGQEYRGVQYPHDRTDIAAWSSGAFDFYPEKRQVRGYWAVEDGDGVVGIHNPTHWQPLPAPPQ